MLPAHRHLEKRPLRMKRCYQHPERAHYAFCSQCGKPCCSDCSVELLGEHHCEPCKTRMNREIVRGTVQPHALRAAVLAGGGMLVFGVVLGPLALFRARMGAVMLDRAPWLRGQWHVRAAWVLGVLAILNGIIWLVGIIFFSTPN